MHRVLSFWTVIILIHLWQTEAKHALNVNETKAILKKIYDLKEELTEVASPYVKITVTDLSPNCVQMHCKFICFNGKSNEIESDINAVLANSHTDCHTLDELRLYNYDFPNGTISRNFLGSFSDKIQFIYIATSNVTDIEDGAFGNGIFKKIFFDNLKIIELRKNFFANISSDFEALLITQQETPIQSICQNFLELVQSQISYLSIQAGIPCVRNMTASNNLLSNLVYLDYSHNSFGGNFTENTFGTLSMVEELYLAHSKITYLPKYIFSNFASTLVHLDISFNYLKTISSNIFGWQKVPSSLKIIANDNYWNCTCELRTEMKTIYGLQSPKIYCETPEEYHNWSVFDERLCETSSDTETTQIVGSTPECRNCWQEPTTTTSTDIETSTIKPPSLPGIVNDDVELICHHGSNFLERNFLKINLPKIEFRITNRPNLCVDVILNSVNFLDEEYGLIWFSKVTKEYYKMEVNYKEYGLGCYGTISYLNTVENLVPNVAYTFCVVQKDQLGVSPFSCKSIHIPGNLNVRYAWLTRDIRTTGISLAILGIVLCTFAGIVTTFLILKNRPILLKGSKRVATTKCNSNEIIVLPKDRSLNDLRQKEEMLAKRSSKSFTSCIHQRRGSTDSNDSYQSYMNANLYEELPAYVKFNTYISKENSKESNYNCSQRVVDIRDSNMVSYAEIPYRHKRTSNDPLPEVPNEDNSIEDSPKSRVADILKHDFELSSGYAFAYDCVV